MEETSLCPICRLPRTSSLWDSAQAERFCRCQSADDEYERSQPKLTADKFPLDRYDPLKILGRGAAGVVYLCRDKLLKKEVAVKVLVDMTDEQVVSFQEEARATAKLTHQGIVVVLDFAVLEEGTPYMVMDYFPGINLDRYLRECGLLDEESARFVFSKLADALAYAHGHGVLHRDLKPSNIMLCDTGGSILVRLIDFGLAKVKQTTDFQGKTLTGTPQYMPPDTIRGDIYDAQSEIYSLGCVLFEAVTGSLPFQADSPLEMLAKHNTEVPPEASEISTGIGPGLSAVVARCMAKEKSERFESMHDFQLALSEQ